MHQTVGNVLGTLVDINPPQNITQDRDISNDALMTAMLDMCTAIATTMVSLQVLSLLQETCS